MGDFLINASSLLIYSAVLIFGALSLYESRASHHKVPVRHIATSVIILSMSVSTVFVVLQALWLDSSAWERLDDMNNVGWIVFDWINGLTHLAFILTVRVFLGWRNQPACMRETCPANKVLGVQMSHTNDLHLLGHAYTDLLSRLDKMAQDAHINAMENLTEHERNA